GAETTKTYLLRRIVGPVTVTNRSFTPPEGDQAAVGLSELLEVWNARSAIVEVVAGSDASTRLAKRRGTLVEGERLTLHFADLNILADELATFGPEVLVLEPAELRAAVIARLERSTHDHAEVSHG